MISREYMLKKQIKVKHEHSNECYLVGTDREYYCFQRMFFGNHAGNEWKRGSHHMWLEFVCNNTDCKYRAVVDSQLIGQQFLIK